MLDYFMHYGFWWAIILCTVVAAFVGFLTSRRFFWRTFICVWPVLLAAWVAVVAVIKYDRGEAGGGFKLGVDLVGGTILVYEIDMRKVDKDSRVDPQQQTALLAESLKRRIDPNDLYNIVIRPAKGEGRVEIILPTGGAHRVQKAEEDWAKLLTDMQQKYGLCKEERPDAPRGKIQELADQIHQRLAIKVWENQLFNNEKDWKALLDSTENRWLSLKEAAKHAELAKVPVGHVRDLVRVLQNELRGETSEREIDTWIKSRAWALMIDRALAKWPQLNERKDKLAPDASDNFPVPPDNFEELVGRIETEGDVIAQATLRTAQPLLGEGVLTSGADKKYFISRKEAAKFIEENYGPSRNAIEQEIAKAYQATGYSRDLTSEEVQRIKDLVAKVGSLEFRILANGLDDKAAIADAKNLINSSSPEVQQALQDAQEKGLPPPAPHQLPPGLKGELKRYTIDLPNNNKSIVTYSWVELGKQERKQLHLDNAAQTDQTRNSEWALMARSRGKALQLVIPGSVDNRPLLQGALFYSRECRDRNLPEEERRAKKYEYFILTRNPEIDPATGKETPKIDGSYLVSAVSQMGNDARPVVAFTFNTTGGNLFGTLTRKNVPSGAGAEDSQFRRHLAIILDGLIESAPTVNSEIRQHGQISGNFTHRQVDQLVNTLRAGALPATLKPQPVSENTMGALLGKDTIDKGVNAVLYSFVAVLAFMIIYYRFAGLVASVALLANLILTVGFMVAVQATFTLPGLAGLVLMLALAVDANVLIYERLREERDRGASLALAIRNGYERAFPTIIDTHLSSIFTAIVLYVVGNDQLKGFGVSLTVGLIISLFTSLYMTRLLFDFWLSRGWLHKLSMARFFTKPDIDFMAIRYYWFTATILLTIGGMALFIGRLPDDLNIDFVGGTAYGGQLTKPYDIDGLRELVSEKSQKKMLSTAQANMVPDSDGRQFELWYDADAKDKRTISLANKVEGDTPQDKVDTFVARAKVLPDPSVEQYFVSSRGQEDQSQPGEEDRNKTPYFNIRTTEKEPELVQAQLDRLLRVDEPGKGWVPLLKKVRMQADPGDLAKTQKETHIKFTDPEKGTPTFASPSFMKTLLVRELHKEFDKGDQTTLPFQVELTGEGKTDEQGRFQIMKLTFSPSLSQDHVKKAVAALERTQREFEDRPQPERLETFDSQLAADTRLRAMYAIVASWLAILLYLWIRFGSWTFGMATVLCLIHDLFFTLGIIACCHYLHGTWLGDALALQDFKIDLTSVAALLTLIGYSVSDTIVVFDRIREVRGKNPDLTPQMINDSVNQTLSRTLLTSFITWLVVFVLYVWGGPGVHLFAFVMVVGVVVGTYSSIYIASPLLLIFGEGTRPGVRRELQPRPAPTAV